MCTFAEEIGTEKQTKTGKIYGKIVVWGKKKCQCKTVRGVNKMLNNEYGFDYHTGCYDNVLRLCRRCGRLKH
jgi:hypothetical protein